MRNICITFITGFLLNNNAAFGRMQTVSFWLYTGIQNKAAVFDVLNGPAILRHPRFNASFQTVLYIHGWQESPGEESSQNIVSAYLERGGYNTIVMNWEKMAGIMYPKAMMSIAQLGNHVADGLLAMFHDGLPVDTFHIVGHSLGAQLSGHIGRNIITKSRGKIKLPRITGLDPAGPFFYPPLMSDHMKPHDAHLVDVIHTDGGFLGGAMPTGTVDFWPNAGLRCQPGCEVSRLPIPLSRKDRCSHEMSWRYYAESVRKNRHQSKVFLAVQARSWLHFMNGFLVDPQPIEMGINCPNSAKGKMYLQTNNIKPFARGLQGIRYVEVDRVNHTSLHDNEKKQYYSIHLHKK